MTIWPSRSNRNTTLTSCFHGINELFDDVKADDIQLSHCIEETLRDKQAVSKNKPQVTTSSWKWYWSACDTEQKYRSNYIQVFCVYCAFKSQPLTQTRIHAHTLPPGKNMQWQMTELAAHLLASFWLSRFKV